MNMKLQLPSSSVFAFFFFFLCFFIYFQISIAQNATTDPSEVGALNSIFQQWDAQAVEGLWNISGEPCTGTAISGPDFDDLADNATNNPAIKCVCTYNNNSTCHITKLRVYSLNKRGEIPKELTALKYLTYLKLDQNYFTGPLPAFIGNLSKLQKLSVGTNALSGTIPKELGNLKELTLLAIGSNNFSGTFPRELGNLVNLKEIYMDSSGVGGEIPSTFASLQNLETVWASDNPFTGRIPDFIGNWTKLYTLRFQGNSFEGPIPSSFSNLISLTTLRISDIYNISSSLDFIKNMKNLFDLVLRNVLITGSIPSDIGEYQALQTLDLSFNNLTGRIPSELFTISSLNYLFLGNNNLTGTIPSRKSEKLQFIDLSYNYLSGSFPSWIASNLQLNLVANNFTFDSSNISIFPGLNCLQKNFPCNRNTPHYTNFAIKCAGPEKRTANGIVYEAENSSVGATSFSVTSTEKWAVSNVGSFPYSGYVQKNLKQVTVTNNPELYQTSRLSPGSLRYYGLGLQNGPYNVSLLFAETAIDFQSSQTWQSVGRRVFDIYVQGTLRVKDFDISKEAGGVQRAITMTFHTIVSENHLEIHLFWAGKGTCCIPEQGDFGPSISALSVVPDFTVPTVSSMPPETRQKKSRKSLLPLIVGIVVSVGVMSLILRLAVYYIWRKVDNEEEEVLLGIGPRPNTISYAELKTATKDFNPSNKLGEGGFGPVYKGTLSDGRVVAVKQLSAQSHQGKNQFVAEIATISAVQHRNLVKLYGFCIEGSRRLLVYEYLENRSLDQAIFGKYNLHLDWPTRFSICMGTGRGLAYLHEESRPRIVHRDVKASNILLDAELCPKISDFGLAKLYHDKRTHITTRVAGTIGYLAPEYAMRGHLTEKVDVFGFGVVALEILSGRPNTDNDLDTEKIYLLGWAWTLYENNRSLELIDPTLNEFNEEEALRVIEVALLCTQASPWMRPPMSRVVAMLAGDIEMVTLTSKPSYLNDWDFKDITSVFINEYTQTSTEPESSNKHKNQHDNSIDLNPSVDPMHSPINITELSDIIGDGR